MQPAAGRAAFIDAKTQLGTGPTRRPDDPGRWRRYLPDGDGPTLEEESRSSWCGADLEVTVEETTGFGDIRAIVSGYPGVALEQLTPFATPPPAPALLPLGGCAIVPTRPASAAPRRARGALLFAAAVAVGVASAASLLLTLLG
jgi:hypothetical protein